MSDAHRNQISSSCFSLLAAIAMTSLVFVSACSDDTTSAKDARPSAEAHRVDFGAHDQGIEDGDTKDSVASGEMSLADLFRSDAATCAEIGATECFSNLDCSAERRCQSLDGAGMVVCCVPGARGSKKAGEPCTREVDCASAVCIAKGAAPSVCSKDCTSADDCPEGMKKCETIAFSGSSQKWCFPQ